MVTGALVAAALAAGLSGGAAAAEHHCKKPRGYTVKTRSRYAIVYVGEKAYGCLFSRGRRVLLIDAESNYTLAGRYVAYKQVSSDPDGTIYYLFTVFDIRKGSWHTLSDVYERRPLDSPVRDGEDEGIVTDTALRKNGSVAWIACAPFIPGHPHCGKGDADTPTEVWRTDHRGTKLLDASSSIRRRSLERDGSRITWRHGSEKRSATLKEEAP